MEESMMANAEKEQERKVESTDEDKVDAEIRQPSVLRTEPRTLNETTMVRAMAMAQKIYAEHPGEDFTKDAIDTATRENAPATDAGDAGSMGRHVDALLSL
ncbi:hypothetical protein M758_8G026500 [Ceratodon purpureus]|nr:hypothetical protein M758_8G026500 [Ceratodon purpureus]